MSVREGVGEAPAPAVAGVQFAVVVTSYNYRDYVVEAVESVLAQSRRPDQVIVVDDGSTDGSETLLRERYANDPRVTLVCTANGGQLAAFQTGVAQVAADVVCFLDSDDRWQPDYLERIGAFYDARPDVDFVFTDMRTFGQRNDTIRFHEREVDLGYTAISTYALTVWYGVPTSAISMRTGWARKTVDLPDAFRAVWRTSPDNCLVYGASVLGAHKYYLPTGSVDYRIHGNNAWSANRSARQAYKNLLHTRALIAHYAAIAGIDDTSCSIEMCKLEYRTKPNPPWSETWRYVRLVMVRRVWPPWRKWERALSVFARGWRSRRA
ncbi:MAG: glycosyltransferase family 2 protein [Xanthomonadaceae bacterium]|nr:glycosyltransferase family 2 protein [Xanthomonadaceae bacterium]